MHRQIKKKPISKNLKKERKKQLHQNNSNSNDHMKEKWLQNDFQKKENQIKTLHTVCDINNEIDCKYLGQDGANEYLIAEHQIFIAEKLDHCKIK